MNIDTAATMINQECDKVAAVLRATNNAGEMCKLILSDTDKGAGGLGLIAHLVTVRAILMTTASLIIMDEIREMLLRKNAAYGNSAVEPVSCFSSSDAVDRIDIRLDDKVSRLMRGQAVERVPEDTEADLIGYLILRRVAKRAQPLSQQLSRMMPPSGQCFTPAGNMPAVFLAASDPRPIGQDETGRVGHLNELGEVSE
jgi:hypothetical protein